MYDADGHVFERSTDLFEFLPRPYRDHAPLRHTEFFPPLDDWNRAALAVAGGYAEGSNSRREEGTPARWIEMLDALGLEGSVLYPTYGMGVGLIRQPDWARAACRAYNDWLHATYLTHSPRLKGMALLPTVDPGAAVEEMHRVAETMPGMVGFFVSAAVTRPYGDAAYDPLWQAAQRLDRMVAVHAGGPGHRLDMLDRAVMARCLGHPTSQMIQLVHMMFAGVFDRFPRVRFSFMEAGIAWALFTLERMEEAYEQWAFEAPELARRPAEHMAGGQLYFHCELGERLLPEAVRQLGDTQLLYASDYPHIAPEKVIAHLREFEGRADLSATTRARILGENARALYGLDTAATARQPQEARA
jgi:uncharacterized protein